MDLCVQRFLETERIGGEDKEIQTHVHTGRESLKEKERDRDPFLLKMWLKGLLYIIC